MTLSLDMTVINNVRVQEVELLGAQFNVLTKQGYRSTETLSKLLHIIQSEAFFFAERTIYPALTNEGNCAFFSSHAQQLAREN